MIAVTCRPLTTWPGGALRSPYQRKRSPFASAWTATMDLLDRELRHLRAQHIVFELALQEGDIRLDGWPRAQARPEHPGVVVSFDSIHGPLRYSCDAFTGWQDNVRAIALGLEALRRVERYGITKRGEQYTGWKALPAGIQLGAAGFETREDAAGFIYAHAGDSNPYTAGDIAHGGDAAKGAYRRATQRLHPDAGGDHEQFTKLQQAKEMLGL